MGETPLIQQYLQLRSEFMGYLYAITRDAELSEEISEQWYHHSEHAPGREVERLNAATSP